MIPPGFIVGNRSCGSPSVNTLLDGVEERPGGQVTYPYTSTAGHIVSFAMGFTINLSLNAIHGHASGSAPAWPGKVYQEYVASSAV